MVFRDRRVAGRSLARALRTYAERPDVIVLGLPRGGVPVAFEIAEALGLPLDVFLVRKLGLPGNEEYAMGAIASGGVREINVPVLRRIGVPEAAIVAAVDREERELHRRERVYRGDLAPVTLRDRTVILVDDGLATGSSMRVAVKAARACGARKIIVAVPVGPSDTVRDLARLADDVVCLAQPEPFLAVGRFYENFDQTTDEEVVELLRRARASRAEEATV